MNDKPKLAGSSVFILGIGLDSRKEAVFRMAFRMNRKASYGFLEPGATQGPDLAIADIDSPEGLAAATAFRQQHPEIPLLATTIAPEKFSQFATLAKPIRMETLFPALEQLLRAAPTTPSTLAPLVPSPSEITASTENTAPAVNSATSAPAADLTPAVPPTVKAHWDPTQVEYFDPEQGLLALVQRAVRDQIPVGIVDRQSGKVLWRIFPEQGKVETIVTAEEAADIYRHGEGNLLLRADASFAPGENTYSMSLTEYLWQTHASIADGRLSQKISLQRPVKLRRWPNLTRLHPLPEALRLAAFLARSPASPALTIRMLQVQPQALFNFLAAADALDLLEYSAANGIPLQETREAAIGATEPAKPTPAKRSLLGRLLSKIAGL